jgi:HAD superfamily hydrolase (TIGR01450 family)
MSRWVIDLDGVVWRGSHLIDGSSDAIARLLANGHDVVFCTNHAQSPAAKRRELDAFGVPAAPVVTSSEAAAAQCRPGDRVLVLGDRTLVDVLAATGLAVVDTADLPDDGPVPDVDVVVVGAHSHWDRSRVGLAADAVRAGARFLATNDDPTYPVSGAAGPRLLPGNGALVAAVSVTAGVSAEVTGKPYAATAELLVERYGPVDVVVGDKPETDGGLAVRLGARFGLVLSGVTVASDLPVRPAPDVVGDDLADVVAQVLGELA